jgi:hypothetical protein
MPGETASTLTEALAMLPVPDHGDMSDRQFKGTACVWCGTPVSTDTAVDLGQRRIRLPDGHITVSPRACRDCAPGQIAAAVEQHASMCESCADSTTGCDIAGALRRLGLEASR